MAVYICCKCGFRFERKGDVHSCPDCGHVNVRETDAAQEREAPPPLGRDENPAR